MTVEVQGQKVTGCWSIMCELILIIKFVGIVSGSRSFKNCASLVGIQCLVPGVSLHTSNIFCKCLMLEALESTLEGFLDFWKSFVVTLQGIAAGAHRAGDRAQLGACQAPARWRVV